MCPKYLAELSKMSFDTLQIQNFEENLKELSQEERLAFRILLVNSLRLIDKCLKENPPSLVEEKAISYYLSQGELD